MPKEYIEKEAAEKAMPDDIYGYRDKKLLRAIPAANVRENVTGEWIPYWEPDDYNGEMVQFGYQCSVCGRWEEYQEPFCNCGADMRGAKDDMA